MQSGSTVPYAQKHDLLPYQWTHTSILQVLARLAEDADSIGGLQERVKSLQDEMLAKVSKVQARPDEHFAGDFRQIVSLVKTFSRTAQAIEHANAAQLFHMGALLQDVPHAYWRDRAGKKLLVEAWIWSVLINAIFRTPFDVYGSQGTALREVWSKMYLAEDDNYWPIPSTLSEKWRYTTAESMRPFDQEVLNLRGYLVALIMEQLGIAASTVVEKQLWNMLNKSSMLAVEMSLQKYRLQVTFPNVGADYNENTMKSRQGFEGNDMECGKVAFVVNPGLTKWGDTHGDNFNYRYDIVPALVQLEPAARTHEMDTSLI